MSSIYSISTIYKATNTINGKSYIGFTTNWPQRKYEHLSNFIKNDNIFYKAINKYGKNSFEWQILYQSKDIEHTKNIMENYFINEYKTFIGFTECNGYNMSLGGDGTLGRFGENAPAYGMRHTQQHKNHIADFFSLNWKCISPEGKVFHIKNLREFCRNNKLTSQLMISVAKGKQIQHKGWKCFYD